MVGSGPADRTLVLGIGRGSSPRCLPSTIQRPDHLANRKGDVMTHSKTSRKALVLAYLQDHRGEWVDGPELANERVGGSEGLKRFRELRAEGYPVEERRHPDPRRSIWQYRLAPERVVNQTAMWP